MSAAVTEMLTPRVQVRSVRMPLLQAMMGVMVMVSDVMCAAWRFVRADSLQFDAPEERQRSGSPPDKASVRVTCYVCKKKEQRRE